MLVQNYLNVREAAAYLGIAVGTLYKLTHRKQIRYFRPNGGKLKFLQSDLENFILNSEEGVGNGN